MLKLAIFVEGQTERIFLEKFFKEYLGYHKVSIESFRLYGNKLYQIRGKSLISNTLIYIQIFDASNDVKAISALKERCTNMVNKGFKYLFALKDVYPNPRTTIPLLKVNFNKLFKNNPCADKVRLLLAIMEIEAWFLADYQVFSKISPFLSIEYIKNCLGIDLKKQNPEQLDHPSKVVNNIFNLISQNYAKHGDQVYKIVNNLDYTFLICSNEVLDAVTSFAYLIKCIDECLSDNRNI